MNARALLLLATLPLAAHAQHQAPDHQRSISITATAKVTNPADTATVHIGYTLYGPDKDAAYSNGSRASNAIIAALKKAGIPDDSIESQTQNIAATQPYETEKLTNTDKANHAFKIEQQWTVRTSATDANKLLDLAIKSGANASGHIEWSLHDPNLAQNTAATKAIQLAQTQAAALASGLNVHLGQLLDASNSFNAEPVQSKEFDRIPFLKVLTPFPEPLAINPRQIETTATVTATFAID